MVKRMCEICSECSKQCSMTWLLAPVVLCVGLRSWSVQPFQQLIKRSKAHAVEIVVGQSKALAFSQCSEDDNTSAGLKLGRHGLRVISRPWKLVQILVMQKCFLVQASNKTANFKQRNDIQTEPKQI